MIRKLIAVAAVAISSLSAPLAAHASTPWQFHAEHARMEQRAALRDAQMRRERDRRAVLRATLAVRRPAAGYSAEPACRIQTGRVRFDGSPRA